MIGFNAPLPNEHRYQLCISIFFLLIYKINYFLFKEIQ